MLHILLIDDDKNILDGLSRIIENHFPNDFFCTTASDGEEAIRQMQQHYFHLIISDNKMSKINGLSLLQILKKHKISSYVIILSGFDDYSYIRTALKNGAYDYLLKPVNIKQLVRIIEQLIPDLKNSLPAYLPSSLPVETEESFVPTDYFDIALSELPKSEDELKKELNMLRLSICDLNSTDCIILIDKIFSNLSEKIFNQEKFQECLMSFVYSLMKHNNSMIQIIAENKLTRYDISNHIKNTPYCSQLKELFKEDILKYIDKLTEIQNEKNYHMIRKAQDYIKTHISDTLAINDISAQFQLSPYYFSTLFKNFTGVCIRDYIVQERINKAKSLLQNPEKKIQDVALESGYQDVAHFNRAFKKITGLSPSKYRTFDH